jgi:hypothetical protein
LGKFANEEDRGEKRRNVKREKQRVDVEKNQRYLSAVIAILYSVSFYFIKCLKEVKKIIKKP